MAIPDPYKKPSTSTPPRGYGLTVPKTSVPSPTLTESQKSAQAWINNPSSGQGGMDLYTKVQNERWQTANQNKDYDLMKRLQSDAQRVGYTLNPYKPPEPKTPNTSAPKEYADWQAKQAELLQKYESLLSTPFQYNPEADPQYQAYRTLAQNRANAAAAEANRATLEEMNNRGILNSSVTASQLSQNENRFRQQAESEALAAIPQYAALARQDYQNRLRNAAELLSFAAGRGDVASDLDYRNQRAARADMEADRAFERGVLESDRDYDYRLSRDQRRDYEADRAFEADQAQREWEQNFQQGQFDWQKAQQLWENQFKEKNFEQQMKEFAAQQGLQWANLNQRQKEFLADEAWKQKNYELELQKMNTPKTADITDLTQYVNSIARYEDGRLINPEQVEAAILSTDLPDSELRKLYGIFGLKWGG